MEKLSLGLSAFFLLLLTALIFSACGGSTPPLEPTVSIRAEGNAAIEAAQPIPTPNIEATVEARIQATLAVMPPTLLESTSMPRLSAVEAIERLRLYFKEASERRDALYRHKKDVESGMFNPVPQGCDPMAIYSQSSYEACPDYVRLFMKLAGLEIDKEFLRPRSGMSAEYQGQGTWVITVQDEYSLAPSFLRNSDKFEEQWWLFESGETPPRKRTVP